MTWATFRGVATYTEATRCLIAHPKSDWNRCSFECLRIGVYGDVFHSGDSFPIHAIDSVLSTSTNTDDFDTCGAD
jgi:hypothetical protein